MAYTAEQVLHIAKEGSWPECSAACFAFAEHLRAFADALEENARIRAEVAELSARVKHMERSATETSLRLIAAGIKSFGWNHEGVDKLAAQLAEREADLASLKEESAVDDATRERMADILTRTAAALKGEPEPLTLHDWSGLPEIAERAASDLAKLRQHAEAMFNWITGDGEYCAFKECEACAIGRAYRADFPEEK